jgi:hypothetical protein
MKRSRLAAVLISVGSAAFALYALEALLAFAPPTLVDRLGTTLRKGPGVISETLRIRSRNAEAYPYLQPDTFTDSARIGLTLSNDSVVTPLGAIPNALTILCNESGTTIGYRSDSLGFRNPLNAWDSTQSTIALVGDSFAHGFCRPESETIAGVIRAAGHGVIDAGLTGAGPLAELGVIREYLTRVKPREVYWLFYEGNDLIDITSERNTLFKNYLDSTYSQHLVENESEIADAMRRFADSVIAAHPEATARGRVWSFLILRRLRTATGLYRQPSLPSARDEKAELAMLEAILLRAKRDVSAWGGTLHLVYLPERRRFNKITRAVTGENHDPIAVEKRVTQIAATLDIPFIDVAAAFAAQREPQTLWNARRYHYNARGYSIVANAILGDLAFR